MDDAVKLTHAKGLMNSAISQIAEEMQLSGAVTELLLSSIIAQIREDIKMQLMSELLKTKHDPELGPELKEFLGREGGDNNG